MEWNSPRLGEYDDDALHRLDEMFELAEKNRIYVVLVLGYHGKSCSATVRRHALIKCARVDVVCHPMALGDLTQIWRLKLCAAIRLWSVERS